MDYKENFHHLIDQEKFEDAFHYLKKFSGYAYEDPFYFANMGWLYNQFHDYENAKGCLLTGLRIFDEDGWMYAQLGCTYNRCMEYEKALQCFTNALRLNFDDMWIHYEMCLAYREQNQLEQALEEIQNALLDAPDNIAYLEECGDLLNTMEQFSQGHDLYEKAYALTKDAYYQFMMAECLEKDGQYQRALSIFSRIDEPAFQCDVTLHRGICCYELQRYQEAKTFLLEASQLGRDDTLLHKTLGDVYHALGEEQPAQDHYQTAFNYYERALNLNEDRRWIYQEMAELGAKLMDHTRLYMLLEDGLLEYGNESWMRYKAARLYSEDERYDRSLSILQETPAALYTETFDYLLAHDLGRAKRPSEAIAVLEKLHNDHPQDTWVLCEYGWNLLNMEYYEQAIECFQQVLQIEEDAYSEAMIGWCYYHLEDYALALRYFETANQHPSNLDWLDQVIEDCRVQLEDKE